jgi:thiamine-monophosphate kinase
MRHVYRYPTRRWLGTRAAWICAETALAAGLLPICLTGGDDYELLLAVPAAQEPALLVECGHHGIAVARIGTFGPGAPTVTVLDTSGQPITLQTAGWSHF